MDSWQATFLGLRRLPRVVTAFEIEAFFQFSAHCRRAPTLIEQQQVACEALGFGWLTDHHRRALVRVLREELARTDDQLPNGHGAGFVRALKIEC